MRALGQLLFEETFSIGGSPSCVGRDGEGDHWLRLLAQRKRLHLGSFRAGRRYFVELEPPLKMVLETAGVRCPDLGFLQPAQRKELSTKRSSYRHDAAFR